MLAGRPPGREYDLKKRETWPRLFSVPDFVGDACKAVASRIRSAIAAEVFDSFHRNSARIIRAAVFGMDDAGKIRARAAREAARQRQGLP